MFLFYFFIHTALSRMHCSPELDLDITRRSCMWLRNVRLSPCVNRAGHWRIHSSWSKYSGAVGGRKFKEEFTTSVDNVSTMPLAPNRKSSYSFLLACISLSNFSLILPPNTCSIDINAKEVILTGSLVHHLRGAVNKTLQFPQHALCVMYCLLHALPRRHASPKPNWVFSVCENVSDTDNRLLCERATPDLILRTLSRPDPPDTVQTWSSRHCRDLILRTLSGVLMWKRL